MGAQGVQHHAVRLHGMDGGLQSTGQALDAPSGPGVRGHSVDVLRDLRRRGQTTLNAVQTGGQAGGEHQVGIAGGVGTPQLHPGALAPGGRDADEGGAVGGGPGRVAGSLIARHQSLVGVHQGIGQGAEALDVSQQARDELIGQRGELPGGVGVEKDVFPVLEQRHIDVHAAAGGTVDGLGHEGGVKAVLLSQGLDRQLEGHNVVSGPEGVSVLEVDLVLPCGHLVVAGFDLEAHLFQTQADLPPGAFAVVQGAQVEVTRLITGAGGGTAILVSLEQEELQLRPGVEGVAHVLGPLQHPFQHVPGIAGEGGAVGIVDFADQPGHFTVLGPPGQDGKGVQVGIKVLVGLLNADETLNGAAVHHDLACQRPLDLGGSDGHIFELAEYVGELHPDELDVLFLDHAEDILLGVSAHEQSPFNL